MHREEPGGRASPGEGRETEPDPGFHEEIPWGQRFFERPFLLLALGIVVMLVFYTGWGLWEVTSLSEAPLP